MNRSPNPRLQRTPSALPPSPLSRKPLGAYGKDLGRAYGESVESGHRRELFKSHVRRPHEQPGPAGYGFASSSSSRLPGVSAAA
jgi:hypothetical protein